MGLLFMAFVSLSLSLSLPAQAASSSSSSTPVRPATPLEEVEAWDPVADGRDPAGHLVVERPNDNGTQARIASIAVLGSVLVGTATGVAVVFVAAGLATSFLPAIVPGLVIGSALFIGLPALAVHLFIPDLPGWTPWLTAGLVPVGAGLFFGAALAGGFAYVQATARPDDDCRLCGGTGALLVFVVPPVAGIVGAVVGGVTATTIGAYAQQE